MEMTQDEVNRGRISIGFPVGKTEMYLLNENLEPIWTSGIRGEICIGGPGLSPGYFNMSEENAQCFTTVQREPGPNVTNSTRVRIYRTGDIGEWRSDLAGCLDFFGRNDSQVKHMTFRVELDEVANSLQANNRIKSAVVVKPPGSPLLIAYIIPWDEGDMISTGEVLQYARQTLPYYMIPNRVHVLLSFPLTTNGKIDKEALLKLEVGPFETNVAKVGMMINGVYTSDTVTQIWHEVLGIPSISGDDDDFFLLGGNSIQSAAVVAMIQKRTGHLITMDDLFRHSRLSDLRSFLNITDTAIGIRTVDSKRWLTDVDIVDQLQMAPNWESEDEGKIFLTGATGFVGSHLLHHLLHRTGVKQVVCLARSNDGHSAESRIQLALEKYDLDVLSLDALRKLTVLDGDMAQADLGLGDDKFTWLANWASVIFHLGVKANFNESYEEHYADNVYGTRNILRLATTGRYKAFHYMSSLDVWGPTGYIQGTREVMEDATIFPYLEALRYDLGYGQSKWVAEVMVQRMQKRGLPCAIYRPGFIIGDSKTGSSNPNDFITRLLVGCIQMGSFPRVEDMRFEYGTMDYVIDSMMHIASSNENLGRCYNLVSHDKSKSITVEETCQLINDTGYSVRLVEYDVWVGDVLRTQLPDGPLACLLPIIQERVKGQLTRWQVARNSPRYDATNTMKALADYPHIKYIKFTPEILRRYINFWNRKGFYNI
jgi:thioester reductase-like protein